MDKYPREHVFIDGIESKECKQCNEIKTISDYHKDNGTKDGLAGICKLCKKKNQKYPKEIKQKAKKTYQNYDWLYNQYVEQNKTVEEISREIGIKNETIFVWLDKFKIPRKTISQSRQRVIEVNSEYREFLSNIYYSNFNGESGFKGRTWTDEDKKRIAEDRKRYFSIKENRQKQLDHLRKIHNSEEVKKKISQTRKEKYSNDELTIWNKGLTADLDDRILSGENHPLFNNWSSLGEYGEEFNQELKYKILKRDNYQCCECGKSNYIHKKYTGISLSIHHIDYDKKNNKEGNLISLCSSCHIKTNFNRNEWETYFKNKIIQKCS